MAGKWRKPLKTVGFTEKKKFFRKVLPKRNRDSFGDFCFCDIMVQEWVIGWVVW